MAELNATHEAIYENVNSMPLFHGKTTHMDVGAGDVANRIITVGSFGRAKKIATFLDEDTPEVYIESARGFLTITGHYSGIRVSIIAIGMGPSMMDFFVRETRAVVSGPLVIVRLGTCGGISEDAPCGTIVVASKGSGYVMRNPDAFHHCYDRVLAVGEVSTQSELVSASQAYRLHNIAPANAELSQLVYEEILTELTSSTKSAHFTSNYHVLQGCNVTAESFYSSQGRSDGRFDDGNQDLIPMVIERYPEAKTMEMETFMLFHLAACCKPKEPIYASAAAIVVANRMSTKVAEGDLLDRMEIEGGKSILRAITRMEI